MKNILLLLAFQLFVVNLFCDDSLLTKFHQHVYQLRDVRTEVVSYNKKYLNKFEIKTFKYNRTTPAINVTVNTKISVKTEQVEVLVQGLKFLSNEYRHFPIRLQVNLRKSFNSNLLGARAMRNCGNYSTDIVKFEKNVTYHTCNFVIDESHLPPLIPSGRYKLDTRLLYLDEELAHVYGFGEVYTPIPYPKD